MAKVTDGVQQISQLRLGADFFKHVVLMVQKWTEQKQRDILYAYTKYHFVNYFSTKMLAISFYLLLRRTVVIPSKVLI